jgi:hypothetical protein
MNELTPDQIKMIADVVKTSAPAGPTMEQIGILVGIVLSVLLILGVLVSVVRFIAKVGALSQKMSDGIEKNSKDITSAHDKIRTIDARVDGHDGEIKVLRDRAGLPV